MNTPRTPDRGSHEAAQLTPEQAADLLNVSPAFLARLLQADAIAYADAEGRCGISASSLIAHKRLDDRRRRAAADELTRLSQDMGLP